LGTGRQNLYDHPAVLEAAVVGVPDSKWGEALLGYVTLREGMAATDREIIEFCRSRLAHFTCPKNIEFRALPKTSTGKIRKNILRSEARSKTAAISQ